MISSIASLLKQHGLRDTQARRMVVHALEALQKPVSAYEIQKWILAQGDTVSTVTVYRIIEMLQVLNVVHRHPCSGQVSLCSLPDQKGHHGFLHCQSCGSVQEFSDALLCRAEDSVARKAKFQPLKHVSEIIGLCQCCVSS